MPHIYKWQQPRRLSTWAALKAGKPPDVAYIGRTLDGGHILQPDGEAPGVYYATACRLGVAHDVRYKNTSLEFARAYTP
jgi:hypothetical protein